MSKTNMVPRALIGSTLLINLIAHASNTASDNSHIFTNDRTSTHPVTLPTGFKVDKTPPQTSKNDDKSDKMPFLSDSQIKGILAKAKLSTKIVGHYTLDLHHPTKELSTGGSLILGGHVYGPRAGDPDCIRFWPGKFVSYGVLQSKKNLAPSSATVRFDPKAGSKPLKVKSPRFLVVYNFRATSHLDKDGVMIEGGEQLKKGTTVNGVYTIITVGSGSYAYYAGDYDPSSYYCAYTEYAEGSGTIYVPRIDVYQIGN